MSDRTPYTLPAMARRVGVEPWQLRRACNDGLISANRVGPYRVFFEADVPAVEEGLRRAGYLRDAAGVTA
jgi:hypothetical protein